MTEIDMRRHIPLPDKLNRRWAAGVFLYRESPAGRLYLLLRSSGHGEWGFPKGHADPGETMRTAAIRECAEECGIGLFALQQPQYVIRYRVRDRDKIVSYWPASTRQERPFLSDEHHEWAWLEPAAVLERMNHANLAGLFTSHVHASGLCL